MLTGPQFLREGPRAARLFRINGSLSEAAPLPPALRQSGRQPGRTVLRTVSRLAFWYHASEMKNLLKPTSFG